MREEDKLCFECEVPPEVNGEFFCSTTHEGCRIKQEVSNGNLPFKALAYNHKTLMQHTSGVKDRPLWTQSDGMSTFCKGVMSYPEERISWYE